MDLENTEENQEPVDGQEVEQTEEVQSNPHEDRARAEGWRPKEEWVEAGHDADDWKSAKSFNEYGDLLGTVKNLQGTVKNAEHAFDTRLTNLNKVHKTQLESQLSQLKAQRKQDVDNGDGVAYDNTQAQIDELERAARDGAAAERPATNHNFDIESEKAAANNWSKANAWINQPGPKSDFATAEYNRVLQEGFRGNDATAELTKRVSHHFPQQNERRNKAPQSEPPRKGGNTRSKSISMSDATPDELRMKSFFTGNDGKFDEKSFVQALKDSRK